MSASDNRQVQGYREKLAEFEALKPGWDSYSGVPIDRDVLRVAAVFLEAIVEGAVSLVPLPDGGVQLECHRQGFDIEVEFDLRGGTFGCWNRYEIYAAESGTSQSGKAV